MMKFFMMIITASLATTISFAAEPTSTAPMSPGMETGPTPVGAIEPGTNPVNGEGAGAITNKPLKPLKHRSFKKPKGDSPKAPSAETK